MYEEALARLRAGDPTLFEHDGTVEIVTSVDPHPKGDWAETDPSGTRITVYPKSRANVGDLTSALGHELNHVRDAQTGRINPYDPVENRASEIGALKWEIRNRHWTGGTRSVRSAAINLRRLETQDRPLRAP